MRSIKSSFSLITLMLLLIVSKGYGNSSELIKTFVQGKSITLSLNEKTTIDVQVRLIDLEGRVLLADKFKSGDKINKKYNLQNLPDGLYNIEVSDDLKILIKNLSIDHEIVSIVKEEKFIKPQFYLKDKMLTVSFLPFGKKTRILIMDEADNELVNELIINEESISRKYNFSEIEIGKYELKVLVDGRVFIQRVNIFI